MERSALSIKEMVNMDIFDEIFFTKYLSFNSFIDKIYYINLSHRKDRDRHIQKQLASQKLIAERFDAYAGSHGYQARIACKKSHAKIIELSYTLKFNRICILEDDAIFDMNFIQIANTCIQNLPKNWDLLFLGHCFSQTSDQISQHLYLAKKIFCTHCYCINNKAFAPLLRELNNSNYPIDHIYAKLCRDKKYNIYMSYPSIVSQIPNMSDIGEGPNTSKNLIEDHD